jgi:hypothetical protein
MVGVRSRQARPGIEPTDTNFMSEPKRDDEPTMEEILASIRKIISEDEPQTAEAVPVAAAGDTPLDADSDGEELEPMELTQMVSEDGSVVDLRAEQKASSGLHGEGPLGERSAEEPAVELSELERDEESGSATVEPLVREGTRVHAELVSEDDDGIQLEPREREPEAAEAELELVAEVEPEVEPEVDTETGLEDVADIEEAQAARAAPEPDLETLVSADATAAATAAMSRLKDRLAAGNAFHT